jgi:hypothetical protein
MGATGQVQMKMQAQKLGPKYQARNWTALIMEKLQQQHAA